MNRSMNKKMMLRCNKRSCVRPLNLNSSSAMAKVGMSNLKKTKLKKSGEGVWVR